MLPLARLLTASVHECLKNSTRLLPWQLLKRQRKSADDFDKLLAKYIGVLEFEHLSAPEAPDTRIFTAVIHVADKSAHQLPGVFQFGSSPIDPRQVLHQMQ